MFALSFAFGKNARKELLNKAQVNDKKFLKQIHLLLWLIIYSMFTYFCSLVKPTLVLDVDKYNNVAEKSLSHHIYCICYNSTNGFH